MSHYKPYPAYKESGGQWLGLVPVHWKVLPLKHVIANIESGTSVNSTDTPASDGELGVLKTSCVYSGIFESTENKAVVPEEYDRVSCRLRVDTLIVSRMNTPDLVGAAGLVTQAPEGIYLPDRLWQISFTDVLPSFAYYWSQSVTYRAQVKMACTGTSSSMQNLSQDQFRDFVFGKPSSGDQRAIAAHLDRETARIDGLVSRKTLFIELLREKRQALITHAVTKGLNPNVKMKDSGVEWLGEVPEHWEVTPIKYFAMHIGSGKTPSGGAEVYQDSGILFLRSQNVHDDGLRLDEVAYISAEIDADMKGSRVQQNDVLLNITGASIGRSCIAPKGISAANVNQHVCIVRTYEADLARWISACFVSDVIQAQIDFSQNGAGREGLNFEQIGNMVVAVPPDSERLAIKAAIDRETTRLDTLISKTERSIELLKERRSALITAAVTGQIDVREAA